MEQTATLKQVITEQIQDLTEEEQRRVLEFVRSLHRPKGVSGKEFLERTKDIRISPDDLELMRQAIEEEFEKVDPNEWDLPA
jgi:hypothetical protein